ncbi:MAG TPA: thiamine pyrophosphate-binding protein [Actinomycetes bacterium]|nr:thiamine pyrophosphate-binding protein [Actinomycetes bacterium]
MNVAEAVGRALAELGATHVFGVVGSGNFHVTNALIAGGARFVPTRHEAGAATAADAYARMCGEVGVLSVHQGPGLTNAMTGLTEAAKSRTPLIALAADTAAGAVQSNFRIDQPGLAAAVGAAHVRLGSADTAVADAAMAYRLAAAERRTVFLSMPLDVQAADCPSAVRRPPPPTAGQASLAGTSPAPDQEAISELVDVLMAARRPVFIAGRGAMLAGAARVLDELADRCGALLATSAVAKGLFVGNPWDLDVSGGFATPLAAELISSADTIVAWGCTLSMWTTRHGALIRPGTAVVQVDLEQDAIGLNQPVRLGIVADVAVAATETLAELDRRSATVIGYRTPAIRERIRAAGRWRDVPYQDTSGAGQIDPRMLTVAVDDLLPTERIVAVDSGNFMGYPSMFLAVPDSGGFCFTQAFQSIGLGLATAIGAALARPDRLPVAALGDGGALMGIAELETVVRLGLPMVILVYNDAGYGAEVHHFGPDGFPLDIVQFPDTDLAAIGRGFGADAITVTESADLDPLRDWLSGPRERPFLIDAKVTRDRGSWWLEEAFRGH